MREFSIPEPQILPSLSTDVPERPYTFQEFFIQWVGMSKGMRENVPTFLTLEPWLQKWDLGVVSVADAPLQMPDALWSACVASAKAAIDDAMTSRPGGATLPLPYAFKVLRFYHHLAEAKQVEAT